METVVTWDLARDVQPGVRCGCPHDRLGTGQLIGSVGWLAPRQAFPGFPRGWSRGEAVMSLAFGHWP